MATTAPHKSSRCIAVAAATLTVAALAGGAMGCGGKQNPIPQHPIDGMSERVRSRINLITLVIHDRERAKAVTETYLELEQLIQAYKAGKALHSASLAKLDGDETDFHEQVHSILVRRERSQATLREQYIDLQLKLRGQLTQDEFVRLDKLK